MSRFSLDLASAHTRNRRQVRPRLDAPEDLFANLPGGGSVKLVPHRSAVRRVHLFDDGRGVMGKHNHASALLSGARHRKFAIGVKALLAARGTDEDRAIVSQAKQLRTGLHLGRVPKPPRTLQL